MDKVLCSATGLDGEPCKRYRRAGENTCKWHDPADIEKRAKALEAQAARIRQTSAV